MFCFKIPGYLHVQTDRMCGLQYNVESDDWALLHAEIRKRRNIWPEISEFPQLYDIK